VSVKDRIAAVEARTQKEAATVPVAPTQRPVTLASSVPIVYPLHYKRFVRRTSASASRPQTPSHTSQLLNDSPIVHAPQPLRSVRPAEIASSKSQNIDAVPENSTAAISAPKRKKYDKDHTDEPGVDRITPASYLHGTKSNCVRHGRRRPAQPSASPRPGAKEMMAKGRNGAYIPTGLTTRR